MKIDIIDINIPEQLEFLKGLIGISVPWNHHSFISLPIVEMVFSVSETPKDSKRLTMNSSPEGIYDSVWTIWCSCSIKVAETAVLAY